MEGFSLCLVIGPGDSEVLRFDDQGALIVGSVVVNSDQRPNGRILFRSNLGIAGVGNRLLQEFVTAVERCGSSARWKCSGRPDPCRPTTRFVTWMPWDTPFDFFKFQRDATSGGASPLRGGCHLDYSGGLGRFAAGGRALAVVIRVQFPKENPHARSGQDLLEIPRRLGGSCIQEIRSPQVTPMK